MAPPRRKGMNRELMALLEDQAVEDHDFGRQETSGPEELPEGNTPVIDNHGGESPIPGLYEREMGNELRKMLEKFKGDMNKALLAKRKRFVMDTNAALKTINQKIGYAGKKRQEQRQKFYREYSQQFLTLFQEWDRDVQKTKEEEDKLAILFHEQRKLFQQARTVQSQRLKKIKTLYDQFLKNMVCLEEDHEHLVTNEAKEFRQEMAKLQNKIMEDAQLQELANIRKSLHCLLF